MKYVYLVLGHRSFFTGKIFIVPISEDYTFIETYRDEAKKKACKHINIPENECSILDWSFLGSDVCIMK